MKSIFTIAFLVTLLIFSSCGSDKADIISDTISPSLLVMLYDISKSNDTYAILKEEHLEKIFDRLAFNGGGKFYALHIKSYSLDQDVLEYMIPAYDTLELVGNPYQIKNRRDKNQTILDSYHPVRKKFVSELSQNLIIPKTEEFTDIKHAMQLAKTTLEQRNFREWEKHLLIISDGENDLPPDNGVDPLTPVDLKNINVVMVRAINSDYISGSSPLLTNSINDGINNL